jgi:hypothetical protein
LTEANPGIALDIPDLFPFSPGDKLPSTRVGPELTLEMKDITKWVNEIEINKMEDTAKISRIVLTGTQVLLTSLQDSMQLKLENIGITNFVNGVLNTEGTELVFTATTTVPHFKPASEEMVIETQFTKVPESGTVNIAVDLQWIKAEIKPGNTGEFEDIIRGLDLSSLGDLLVGAQFGEIPAYLYISGLDNANARMSLSAAAGETPITPDVLTEHDVVSTSLPVLTDGYLSDIVATETSVGQFFLQDVFNAGGNVAITYKIKIDTLTIPNDADHINQKIKADMVVVLPLRLTINSTESFKYPDPDPDPDPAATPGAKKTYVKLDLDALSDLTGDGKDLLGRDPGDDSLFIDGLALDRATILISGIKNGVIDGLYLAVIKDPNDPSAEVQVISLNEGKSGDITFTGDELRSPFSPTFQLLVEKGEYIFVKTFDDEHPATLDLNLALSARTDLNISQKF